MSVDHVSKSQYYLLTVLADIMTTENPLAAPATFEDLMFRHALTTIASVTLVLLLNAPCWSEDDAGGRWGLPPSDIYFDFLLRDPTVWFETTITQRAVEKTPIWKEKDEHPPLSARRAIQLADRLRSQLVKDANGWRWCLESVKLTPWTPEFPSGRWFWEVTYHALPPGGYAGPLNELHLAVLMDGTVVQPKIGKRRSESDGPARSAAANTARPQSKSPSQ